MNDASILKMAAQQMRIKDCTLDLSRYQHNLFEKCLESKIKKYSYELTGHG